MRSAIELGALNAAKWAPFLLVSLLAGVYVDRYRRRPLLIVGNLISALVVGTVPLASAAGMLSIPGLWSVAFVLGVLTVFLNSAFWA